jgi:hypothetical protein
MPLPHFSNLAVNSPPGGPGSLPQEPVYTNLFEISFVLPLALQAAGRDPFLLLQQALTVDLSTTNKPIGKSNQRFKYSTRAFLNAGPSETHIDSLAITFNVNVNNNGSMETWTTLKQWYDLAWNSQNGYLHYKADMVGTIIVNQHDKKGLVLRRVTFQNCQLSSITNMASLTYEGQGILANISADFVVDYWQDEYIDNGTAISPPLIDGY